MPTVVDRVQKITEETHKVQSLLEYVMEDIHTGEEVLMHLGRIESLLNVLQEKFCEIDGMQQLVLLELKNYVILRNSQ